MLGRIYNLPLSSFEYSTGRDSYVVYLLPKQARDYILYSLFIIYSWLFTLVVLSYVNLNKYSSLPFSIFHSV